MALTLDQEQALFHLEGGKQNVFITGGAGTGKSYILRSYLTKISEKIPVLASTGAAAILIGGRTFHSFFGLGVLQGGADAVFQKALDNKRLKKRLLAANQIVIDEISMLSSETLDCAERIAKALRKSDQPWGGLRVIAVGDFAQLPPVSKTPRKDWAFLGEAWALSEFKRIELKEVMRTGDRQFLAVLEDVRLGQTTRLLKDFLESHLREEVDKEITHLFPRRDQTERFNLDRLSEIDTKSKRYETLYGGDSKYFDQLKRDAPIPEVLELKKGAIVMLRMNDPKQRFVNGTLGRVLRLDDDLITLETSAGKNVEIEPYSFTVEDADGNEAAYAKNFPMNLAYASTIHKVQGATIDRIHADLSRLWEPGQAYVALSRVRRAEDVSIMRWTQSSIRADSMVAAFYGRPQKAPTEDFAQNRYDQMLTESW